MSFKFDLGAILVHQAMPEDSDTRLYVVGRISEECSGGTQYHYDCRAVFRNGGISDKLVRFNEKELMAGPPFSERESASWSKALSGLGEATKKMMKYMGELKENYVGKEDKQS